jgi:hypothetical protein
MLQRGRKSAAAIEMENLNVEVPTLPISPGDVPPSLKAIVDDLIESQPADHFRSGDGPLLQMYAEVIIGAREAFSHLEKEGRVVNGKVSGWVTVQEKAHRSAVALAAKLRLCPQQRMDSKQAARAHDRGPGGFGVLHNNNLLHRRQED